MSQDSALDTLIEIDNKLGLSAGGPVPVSLSGSTTITGTVDQGAPNTIANAWPVKPTDGTNTQSYTAGGAAKVDGSATTQPVSSTNLDTPLSTLASQATLAALNAKVVVVDTGNVTVANFPASQAVTGPLTDTQLRATAVPVSVSGIVGVTQSTSPWVVSGTVIASGPLTDTQLRASAVPVSGTFFQATQPVSGTVTANAGTNLNTSLLALESGGNLAAVATSTSSTATNTSNINAKFGSLGQKAMAGSAPVVISSDQSAIPVTGTFFQATQPVSGTVTANAGTGTFAISAVSLPLPTGASTESTLSSFQTATHSDFAVVEGKQDTGNTSLASIKTNTDKLDVNLSTVATQATLALIKAKTDNIDVALSTRATETTLGTVSTNTGTTATNTTTTNTRVGDVTETAPATDTASSGLNGRLQRVAQRLTSLIAFFSSDFGVSSAAIRVASMMGNATGAANFGGGTTTTQTLRTVLVTDQTTIPIDRTAATAVAPTTVSVTTSATLVSASNSNNRIRYVRNDGVLPMYFGFTNAVTTTNGQQINANGTYIEDVYSGDIYCIVSAGTATARVQAASK